MTQTLPMPTSRLPHQYWLIIVCGDVEAELQGPFETDELRDAAAKEYRADDGGEFSDGIHWLDIDSQGIPSIGDYSGAFFDTDEGDEDAGLD